MMMCVCVLQQVHRVLKQLHLQGKPVRKITVTGHSLGGAMAMLAACDIAEWMRNNTAAEAQASLQQQDSLGSSTGQGGAHVTTARQQKWQQQDDISSAAEQGAAGAAEQDSVGAAATLSQRGELSAAAEAGDAGSTEGARGSKTSGFTWPENVGVITFAAPRVGVRN